MTIVSLTVAGLLLILAEVFLPGMIAGIFGALLLATAAVLCGMQYGFGPAIIYFVGVTTLGLAGFFLWMRYFPQTFAGKRMIHTRSLQHATSNPATGAVPGDEGVALTMLRPSGTARIRGNRLSVIAEMGFIEEGQTLTVTAVEGSRIVVAKKLAPVQGSY